MLTRLLSAGLLAGALAGLCVAALQQVTTVPLILKAETYEHKDGAPASRHEHSLRDAHGAALILVHAPADGNADAAADAEEWAPEDGLQRTLFTSTATVATAVGFALMLLAVMAASGAPITASTGALWGAAGFVATGLASGLGLAPELPGSVSADLVSRQIWWIGTAAATAAGLWLIWRGRSVAALALALAMIAAPHIIGAPHAQKFGSTVPAELASHFTSVSLGVHAILWVTVGALAGAFWAWQDRVSARTPA